MHNTLWHSVNLTIRYRIYSCALLLSVEIYSLTRNNVNYHIAGTLASVKWPPNGIGEIQMLPYSGTFLLVQNFADLPSKRIFVVLIFVPPGQYDHTHCQMLAQS